MKVVEIMMAIDPDTRPDDPAVLADVGGRPDDDFDPVEPDVADVADLGGIPSCGVAK